MNITDTTMKLPTVVLDTTLTDLYRQSGSPCADKCIGQVLGTFSATLTLGPKVPPNRKYIYQDSPFTSSHDMTTADDAITTIKYLSLLNQRDAFMCGTSPAIFFHMGSSPQRKRHDQKQVVKTLATLSDAQRPPLVFCDGPEYIPIKEANIDVVACKAISDYLEGYENVVPLETHWFLNTKRALAESGLPTPKSVAVTVEGFPINAESCCALCIENCLDGFVIPSDCVGARGTWLREESSRLYQAIESYPLPFVLKNQMTFGGAGTFIVRTEKDRQGIINDFGKGFLCRLLSSVNEINSHLEPATLLFSDLIQDPIGDYGITFFVNEKGRRPIFLGVSEQIIEGDTAWVGSIIDYRQQNELRVKFSSLVVQISEWLQSCGYLGPAGADVLEDADGTLYVVDLNVRTTGSCSLPLLRTHFTSRGLDCASSFAVDVEKRRDEFINMFLSEFQQGRMCILSWYEDEMSGCSLGHLVVGAQDEVSLKELTDRVRETCGHVIF
ncbi:hypothetical protein LCI18_010255 [Fusarium solani-melongenae]|uniref:Uncharacterized protein n=1 Tax=Fusarium solani subsp. cucurbitae TaxID=2747967 RepID=A0ACD3ZDN2_FUSSC|nr:hypothetical protein LCI18_010255 [Fusarium solani-melongenae]